MQWSNLPVIGLIRPLGCASVELNLGLSQSAGRGPIELLRFHRQNGYLVRLRLPDGSFAALPSPEGLGEADLGFWERQFVAGVNIMATYTNRNPASDPENAQLFEEKGWQDDPVSDFVLVQEIQPPRRIELARERMLLCRLYLGLIRSMSDDYGGAFAAHSDSATFRTIGIYVFLRTVMCSPVRASTIAQSLKLPRVTVLRRLNEMVKHGYVERVGNAYRVTDKVNIPDLKMKLSRRVNMIMETARALSELHGHQT
jgi:hypothetical protein